jgi:hypothetical protein
MTAILEPRERRVRATSPARRVPAPDGADPTPLFTRHTLGAIEADRDGRPEKRQSAFGAVAPKRVQ